MPRFSPAILRLLRWLPAVAWAAVIFAGSSIPGTQLPGRFSVLGHLGEYIVFGALLAWAMRVSLRPAQMLAVLALCAIYGASDEFHQSFVPFRTPDPVDLLLDIVGSAIGIAAVAIAKRRAGSEER